MVVCVKFFPHMRYLALKLTAPQQIQISVSLSIILWSMKYSFQQKVRRAFLSLVPLLNNFFKILFYGDHVSHGTSFCTRFHDRWPNSLRTEKSQRNHRNGCIRASLAPLSGVYLHKSLYKRINIFKYLIMRYYSSFLILILAVY